MDKKKIVMLAGVGDSTAIIYNHLSTHFSVERVIIEESVSKKLFLKRRIKNLGVISVIGQVLFRVLVVPVLEILTKSRVDEIIKEYGLDLTEIPTEKITRVSSVNSDECIRVLCDTQPDVVVINGTRIIAEKILRSVPVHFINTHSGITPKYRGSHGGYWAIMSGDTENFGVTVHLVDPGIDTGDIVSQATVSPTKDDSFVTYPYIQCGLGLPLLKRAVEDCLADTIETKPTSGKSEVWYHPTLWGYLYARIVRGVK